MSTFTQLNELERRVLTNLNEAGEDYASALLNSVFKCAGVDSQLTRFITALRRLFEFGLIEIAEKRDDTTLGWNVLPHDQTVEKLNMLSFQLRWEAEADLWQWNANAPRLTILLTQPGVKLSINILEKFGWGMTEPI